MTEEIKLPEDLLLEIQKLRDELTQNVVRIGRLNVQAAFLKKDLIEIESELNDLYIYAETISVKENEIQSKVASEYGDGKLYFDTGVFVKESK